jgi:hypothetical protein
MKCCANISLFALASLTLCSFCSYAIAKSRTIDISAQIGVESWFPSGDLDTYWNPHKAGLAAEISLEYLSSIDVVFAVSEHEFEPSYHNDNLLVPDLSILAFRGGSRVKFMQTSYGVGFLETGFLWAITSFSSDEITFPGHSARESEGGVYLGGGIGITVWHSWSLLCSCRGHRVFSQPEPMEWLSLGIGIRKTWCKLSSLAGICP